MESRMIPFATDNYYGGDGLKGLSIGDTFHDGNGYLYRLYPVTTAAINNTFAAGEVITLAASRFVTNDVSAGLDATNPIAAGIAMGSIPESTTATLSESGCHYALIMVQGYYATVKTNGDDDIAASDLLIPDAASDGACNSWVPAADALQADVLISIQSVFGVASADDVNADDTVAAFVKVRF